MNGQQEEFDYCRNRHKGDPESTSAHRSVNLQRDRKLVLDVIAGFGEHGATLDEVAAILNRPPNQISGRITELKAHKVILGNGERRLTRSGCFAKVYIKA